MSKAKEAPVETKPKRKKPFWLANKQTKEVHRLIKGEEHPKQCNLDSAEPKNLTRFKTFREARENGFDMAAHCRARFKSRDNK